MAYSKQISALVKKHGADVVAKLQKEASNEIRAAWPEVEFELVEEGVVITNYEDALEASEEGSILCEGQVEAETWIESQIIDFIRENV